ncbi:MAG: queuosine salvage family protein [bacterium]
MLEFFIKNFKSFEDVSIYKNQNIYFYKLAQLVVSDRYSLLPGTEFESLIDKNSLTALADYKVPQMLRLQNILEYDNSLEEKIVKKIEIPHDSEEEIEIRANTVQAIEKIKEILIIDNP